MEKSLKTFRDGYLETLLRFLWREWTALGVAGQECAGLHHVIDPEALLLFTCSVGRYDQRLFDEVMDWLTKNGRFLNIQRLKNILRREAFRGGAVLSAVADWLLQRDDPVKWRLLARVVPRKRGGEPLFYLPDGRPLPRSAKSDPTFLKHGLLRSPLMVRGYSMPFSADALPCIFLKMRALFGVNARCDALTYLLLNKSGHPREVAREMYYSQKAIHDVMTDLECSGVVHSSRLARERRFRISSGSAPVLPKAVNTLKWINWPIMLATAESVWFMTEELRMAVLKPHVESSEIVLTMKPLLQRLTQTHWAPSISITPSQQGVALLEAFQAGFATVAE
ncbi:MAG: hypothetical protein NTZ09_03815 [Candidatus Hydrogenedentes bacterium]|nr:hypothetical protein [Candidatus Hydrogenedentota bacterium]